jgi:hypothetical protein
MQGIRRGRTALPAVRWQPGRCRDGQSARSETRVLEVHGLGETTRDGLLEYQSQIVVASLDLRRQYIVTSIMG